MDAIADTFSMFRRHHLFFLCVAIIVGVSLHCLTLSYSPVHWIDDVAISEIARDGVGSRTENWTLSWIGPNTTARTWALYWFGGWVHELGYKVFGESGPRIVMLGFLVVLSGLVCSYLYQKTRKDLLSSLMAVLVFSYPSLTQSVRGGRVDVIAFAFIFLALNILCINTSASHFEKLKFFIAGCCSAMATFSWVTAIMVIPLVLWEIYETIKSNAEPKRVWMKLLLSASLGFVATSICMTIPFWQNFGDVLVSFRGCAGMNLTDVNDVHRPVFGFLKRLVSLPGLYVLGLGALFTRRRFFLVAVGVTVFSMVCLLTWTYVFRMLYFLPYAIVGLTIAASECKKNGRRVLHVIILLMVAYSFTTSIFARNISEYFTRRFRNYNNIAHEIEGVIGRDAIVYNEANELYYIGRNLNWKQYRIKYRSSIDPSPLLSEVDYFITKGDHVDSCLHEKLLRSGLESVGVFCVPTMTNLSAMETYLLRKNRLSPLGPYCVYARSGRMKR